MSTDPAEAAAAAVASELLGTDVKSAERVVSNGRNSRIYWIRSGNQSFALKQYPTVQSDPRDRLRAETEALHLMEQYGIGGIPRVAGVHLQQRFVLLSWIEGDPVNAVHDGDIDAAAGFLTAVHALRQKPEAQSLPLAAEACLSGAEIERQIRARLLRLNERRTSEAELATFLDRPFLSAFERMLRYAVARMSDTGLDFDAILPRYLQSVIPADFGFHNCLRRPDGRLAFLDFEYFGWDDPVKLTADFLLHPGMKLDSYDRLSFRKAAEQRYAEDLHFAARLEAFFPLFGLRWVLVLLNEFLPERWHVRVNASGGKNIDWLQAKTEQLTLARSLLDRVSTEVEVAANGKF